MTPQHRLWPLLGKDTSAEAPQFFYLRAFLAEGSSTCPVSLLLTLSTLYLLDEDPVGSHAESPLPVGSGEASEQLTDLLGWIREPWEELFSIGLRTVTQEALDLDR